VGGVYLLKNISAPGYQARRFGDREQFEKRKKKTVKKKQEKGGTKNNSANEWKMKTKRMLGGGQY
jgi:hypothetical protein